MTSTTSLCVYCGSAVGNAPAHRARAAEFGRTMAERGIRLIYGGGRIGLMGAMADAAIAAGGLVTGVIPDHLQRREVGHQGITELRVVGSMHERKRVMSEIADGFVILPGGLGTLDEAFETITWRQLGLHDKPIVIADFDGYWAPLRELIEATIAAGFARPSVRGLFEIAGSIEAVFAAFESAPPPRLGTRVQRM